MSRYLLWAAVAAAAALPCAGSVTVERDDAMKKVVFRIGNDLFTEFRYNTHPKPILFPVLGPGGLAMTRQWPMQDAAPGEEKDHPHHKSIWFTHGSVNGVDFWMEGEKAGKVVTREITKTGLRNGYAFMEARNEWLAPDGSIVCSDTTLVECGEDAGARFIDFSITLRATHGEVKLGDTKEGTMAIRTRPEFQLDRDKNKSAAGSAVNSEGQRGKEIWGQAARWVDYHGPVVGEAMGVAIFDHPSNPRHPTTWHARDYGLIAANPFGWHDFSNGRKPEGAGDLRVAAGESATFRYRFLFHRGDTAEARIADRWKAWAEKSP